MYACAGDSRAILGRKGVAVVLTSDHKASRDDEVQRVQVRDYVWGSGCGCAVSNPAAASLPSSSNSRMACQGPGVGWFNVLGGMYCPTSRLW